MYPVYSLCFALPTIIFAGDWIQSFTYYKVLTLTSTIFLFHLYLFIVIGPHHLCSGLTLFSAQLSLLVGPSVVLGIEVPYPCTISPAPTLLLEKVSKKYRLWKEQTSCGLHLRPSVKE